MTWASLWAGETRASALPQDWERLWGDPSPFFRRQLRDLKRGFEELAVGIELSEASGGLADLVHPQVNASVPVHRWYHYKEAFSYRLPREVIARLGTGESRVVADVFGGVGTTGLALQCDPRVERVISIEYSPLAHLVGTAKLAWARLSPRRMQRLAAEASRFRANRQAELPELAAFHNPEIFHPVVAADLVSAQRHVDAMDISAAERRFLLVGLAAIVEDCSGAMKDGRALRIVRDRHRRASSLGEVRHTVDGANVVRPALRRQWLAMVDDLVALGPHRSSVDHAKATHLRGDARHLDQTTVSGRPALADASVGLHCYSPPYLNCIDYTEVYKLELWCLGLVTTQAEFRDVRLGTLRSHPSIEFPSRPYVAGLGTALAVQQVEAVASFLERNNVRVGIGRMVRNYFADMTQVLREQHRTLEPGGRAVCIVGNSTFSRRDPKGNAREEQWRVPILTDVLLAALGRSVGFESAEIWSARDLRPRNVGAGAARESFVVLGKASG
jgi:hypothetical protein